MAETSALFSLFAWLLEGFVLTECKKKMFGEESKLRELSFQTHDILVPLHVESDSCDHSRVEYFHSKNRLGKLCVLVFSCEGKILSTLFGDVFHLATLKNISVASWRLPKKSYLGPCA